jgi:hypothetical protein
MTEHYPQSSIGLEEERHCRRCGRVTPYLITGPASSYCVSCLQRRLDALREKQRREAEKDERQHQQEERQHQQRKLF